MLWNSNVKQLCYRPITKHGSPLVGLLKDGPGNTKAFLAAGHGPWGITLGPGKNFLENVDVDVITIDLLGTGKVMAELILGGKVSSADISRLDPAQYL